MLPFMVVIDCIQYTARSNGVSTTPVSTIPVSVMNITSIQTKPVPDQFQYWLNQYQTSVQHWLNQYWTVDSTTPKKNWFITLQTCGCRVPGIWRAGGWEHCSISQRLAPWANSTVVGLTKSEEEVVIDPSQLHHDCYAYRRGSGATAWILCPTLVVYYVL